MELRMTLLLVLLCITAGCRATKVSPSEVAEDFSLHFSGGSWQFSIHVQEFEPDGSLTTDFTVVGTMSPLGLDATFRSGLKPMAGEYRLLSIGGVTTESIDGKLVHRYLSDHPLGVDSVRLEPEVLEDSLGINWCKMGSYISSWVPWEESTGPVDFFRKIVLQGESLDSSGTRYRRTRALKGFGNRERVDLLHVDADTHLPTLWESHASGVVTRRTFTWSQMDSNS